MSLEETDALIRAAQTAPRDGRLPMDRYRDFRQLFLGSDQGKRVLMDILDLAHYGKVSAVRGDPHWTYLREGERNTALMILEVIQKEPTPAPAAQQTRREDS